MNDLKERLDTDVKAALKAGEKQRVGALRLVLAAIKQREVDDRIELDDEQVLDVLIKLAKQRRESIDQFQQGGREDLVAKETYELDLLNSYLPKALSEEELDELIAETLAKSGATSMKDMGKVMGALKSSLHGRGDMGAVSAKVKALLA